MVMNLAMNNLNFFPSCNLVSIFQIDNNYVKYNNLNDEYIKRETVFLEVEHP